MFPISVLVDEHNKEITLWLNEEQRERVITDRSFLQELVEAASASNDDSADNELKNESETSNDERYLWPKDTVHYLLSLYDEYKEEFNNNGRRHSKIWADIAKKIEEAHPKCKVSGVQCQTKLNGLKRTFKKCIDHNTSGGDIIRWPYFDKMKELFGSTNCIPTKSSGNGSSTSEVPPVEVVHVVRKRTLEDIFENYVTELRKERALKKEENLQQRIAKEQVRQQNFNRLLELKKQQHSEKMEMLQSLCKILESKSEPTQSDVPVNGVVEKTSKRKKTETIFDEFFTNMKEEQESAREEKESVRQERSRDKAELVDELIKQKTKQHKEKLEMVHLMFSNVSEPK